MTDELDAYSLMVQGWHESHKLEKAEREAWAKLDGWINMWESEPAQDERVLIRHHIDLPCIGYRDHIGWWCAMDGDIWPLRVKPTVWRPIP